MVMSTPESLGGISIANVGFCLREGCLHARQNCICSKQPEIYFVVTTTYIQSKTIIIMLFLFLEHHHVPNKFWIFVGHNNVKDRLSVKRIGLQVPAIFTKTTKAKFSFTLCCEDVNLQVFVYGFCSTCLRSPRVPANAAGSGWLEKGAAGAVL